MIPSFYVGVRAHFIGRDSSGIVIARRKGDHRPFTRFSGYSLVPSRLPESPLSFPTYWRGAWRKQKSVSPSLLIAFYGDSTESELQSAGGTRMCSREWSSIIGTTLSYAAIGNVPAADFQSQHGRGTEMGQYNAKQLNQYLQSSHKLSAIYELVRNPVETEHSNYMWLIGLWELASVKWVLYMRRQALAVFQTV